MKRAIAIIVEVLLFLFAFLAGSLLAGIPAAHVPLWAVQLGPTRYFVLDGLFLMVTIYLILLLFGALRHRAASAAVTSTTALLLALALGLAMKFGFVSR